MIDTKTAFENIGQGFSMASGWITINGRREWVSLTATTATRGDHRRLWTVAASYGTGDKRVEAIATVTKGFRYEAADEAITALTQKDPYAAFAH